MLDTNFPDTVYAIQHVSFEDLGSLEDVFYQLGYRVRYFEAGVDDLSKAFQHKGLVVILGGPIGVNDESDYPFINDEINLLKSRLAENLPTIGICLGAQLIAKALGAKVYSGHMKEIGWSKLTLASSSKNILSSLQDIEVLHWHGDTFDLPNECTLLAGSSNYPNQAFAYKNNVLALQFHLEVIGDQLEKWLIGHHYELKAFNVNINNLRDNNLKYAQILEFATAKIINKFMQNIIQ
jgi:GMP synthase (glutamine-hydrolysing)